ncbi:MAG: hypothetical protein IJP66_05250 [Kiritimatiellae bacterium]|nr:hypothetical protein [Kiritimatiellia bacterium]
MTNALFLASQILVVLTGYGDSPHLAEIVDGGMGNLYVQWSRAANLLPGESKILDDELLARAKGRGVRVMTIYGNQNGATTKRLRETWGDLYLGNNIGEYAGFLYQDKNSFLKGWPESHDLREAHDWLVGEMLAGPRKAQRARPEDEREPCLFSTSGSPLACYELEGGLDIICNEMFAVGCGDLAYAASEARGAARRHGRPAWTAWLAHEWQTCWRKLPYGVAQKQDSLEVGLKELWIMGASMLVLESGSQGTQAHDYTPPDGECPPDTKTPPQGHEGPIAAAYRGTMKAFYEWTLANPRAAGQPVAETALLLGNYDGYVGMTYPSFAIFGQHHIAATNAHWRCAAPERTWEAVMGTFFPHPGDALAPFTNGWLGGTPHGQPDVMNIDDNITLEQLSRYKAVAFGGWNTMTPEIAEVLRQYVAGGGQVALCVPQLSGRIDREFEGLVADDLVQAVPGVELRGPGDAVLGEGVTTEVELDGRPYVVRAPHGKGAYWLCLDWAYPAADVTRREAWCGFLARLMDSVPRRMEVAGDDLRYVNWAVYPDGTAYFLNTDCVRGRSVTIDGVKTDFAPKEFKVLRAK